MCPQVLADYIASRGVGSRGLRDEILVQLCNQASGDGDRVWQLLQHCLAAFQPGPALHKWVSPELDHRQHSTSAM